MSPRSEKKPRPERCAHCSRELAQRAGPGRPPRYCSPRCRRLAARERQRAGPGPVERSDPLVNEWLKECGI